MDTLDSQATQQPPNAGNSATPESGGAPAAPDAAPPRAATPAKPPVAAATPKTPPALVESSPDPPVNKMRRRIVWSSVTIFLTTSFLIVLRFFLQPSILVPSIVFRVGFPSDYSLRVDSKW